MSKKRYVNDSIRSDNRFIDLDPIEKLLFTYLLTNDKVSICWIYEIPVKKIAYETGIDKETVVKLIWRFEEAWKVHYVDWRIIVINFLKNQALNENMKKGIARELEAIGEERLETMKGLKGFERVSKALEGFGILNLTLLNLTLLNSTREVEWVKLQIVSLSDDEYDKLITRYPKKAVNDKILAIETHCRNLWKKWKDKYKDFYLTTINWLKRDWIKENPKML